MIAAAVFLVSLKEEVYWRAAIHQAYYGVYHLACETLGLDPAQNYATEARHADVLRQIRTAKTVSSRLTRLRRHMPRLRELRGLADYDLGSGLSQDEARLAVASADYILKASG